MNALRTALRAWLDRHVPLMAGELSTLDRLDNAGEAAEQGVRVTAER